MSKNRYKRNESVVLRDVAGEKLLIPVKGRLADLQNIFVLEGLGEWVWEQLDGVRELEEIEMILFNYIRQIVKISLLVSHARENKVFTKSILRQSLVLSSNLKPENTSKKDKTPTAEISFDLFKKGKSVPEIAQERGFVEGTILGHLCQYIETGEIDATKIIDAEKLTNILKVQAAGDEKSSEIKAALSDDYSYAEIKVALAHFNSLQKEG